MFPEKVDLHATRSLPDEWEFDPPTDVDLGWGIDAVLDLDRSPNRDRHCASPMTMLGGTRVLDLSHLLPGQYATSLLAQLGADVVTVEAPDGGHVSRQYPASFAMYNHSKRSVVLDLKDERGTEAFLSLAAEADVVVEQFRPGVVERLGVDHEAVAEINSDVVYCSISGYGESGPYANRVGHDLNYAATAGILDQMGQADDPPVIPSVPMVDLGTGVFAALSVCAALVCGGGEYIDLSMADVAVNEASSNLAEFFGRGFAPDYGESLLTGGYPCYAIYKCANGEYLSVAATEPRFWRRLCEDMGLSEYADVQFPTGKRREEAFDAFETRFQERKREEWLETIDETRVPVAAVLGIDEVPADEHVQTRGLVHKVTDGDDRRHVVGFPAEFENHEVSFHEPPNLGEHTETLLDRAGYDAETVAELAEENDVSTDLDE